MVCDLSQNNLKENLENYVNALIGENLKNPAFSYNDIVKTIHKDVMDEKDDLNQALGIAYHVPQMVYDIIRNNPEYNELEFVKKGYDPTKLLIQISQLKDAEDKIAAIANMIGIDNTSVADIEKVVSEQPTNSDKIYFKVEGSDELAIDNILSVSSYFTTAQQTALESWVEGKLIPSRTLRDEDKAFYQDTLSKIILAKKDDSQDFTEVVYNDHKGFMGKLMFENKIPGKIRANREAMLGSNIPTLVITDTKGDILYFDKNGNISDINTGRPVYFVLKATNANNTKKIISSAVASLSKNLTKEEREVAIANIEKRVSKQFSDLETLKSKLKDGENVMVNITGGSPGVVQDLDELDTAERKVVAAPLSKFDKNSYDVKSITYVPEIIKGSTVNVPAVKFKNAKDYVTLKNSETIGTQAPDLLNNIVNVLTEDLGLSNVEKVEYVGQFINLTKKVNVNDPDSLPYSIGINPNMNNKLFININNKNVPLENKEEAKKVIKEFLADNVYIHFNDKLLTKHQYTNHVIEVTPTGYKITNTEELEYAPFIFSKLTPRAILDKNTNQPMILNGYFTFEPLLTQQEVETQITDTTAKLKEENIPTNNDDQENEYDDLKASKLIENAATPQQNAKAKNWWANESALSKAVDENGKPLFTLNLLRNVVNSDAWATFSGSVITLYKGASFTQVYHEAWHAFSQVYLTKNERTDLYKTVVNLKGSFEVVKKIVGPGSSTFEKVKVNFKDLDINKKSDRLLIEEFIAEEFRKFAVNNGTFKTKSEKNTTLGKFFNRIWKALKALVKGSDIYSTPGSEGVLGDIFRTLYQAKTANDLLPYLPNLKNAEFGLLNSGGIVNIENPENDLSISEGLLLTRTIDGVLSNFVTERVQKGNFSAATKIFSSRKALTNVYKEVQASLNKRRDELLVERSKLSPNDEQSISIIDNKLNLLTRTLNEKTFGDINKALAGQSADASVIAFHRNNSIFKDLFSPFKLIKEEKAENDSDTGDYEETDENSKEQLAVSFDQPINNVASEKLADDLVLYLIKSLTKQDKDGNPELNELGFAEPIEFLPFWRVLMDKASGQTSVLGLYNKLKEAGDKVSPLFKQLLSKIYVQQTKTEGDKIVKLSPEDSFSIMFKEGSEIGDLWMKFVQSTNLHKVDLVSNYIKTNKDGNLDIRVGKTSADYQKIINTDWPAAFQQKEVDDFINKIDQVNYINLDTVANRYLIKGTNTENENTYVVAKENYIPFLNSIGIYLDNISEIKDILTPTDINFIAEAIGKVNDNAVGDERNIDNIITYLAVSRTLKNGTKIPMNSYAINYLAEVQATFSTDYATSMKFTADNNLKSTHAYNNTDTQKINAIKNSNEIGDLYSSKPEFVHMNSFNPVSNPATKGLIIFKSLYATSNGKKIEDNDINYRDLSGTTLEDEQYVSNGISHAKMGFLDKVLSTFISTLGGGYMEGVQAGDKSSNFAVKLNYILTYKGKVNKNLYVDTVAFIKNNSGESIMGIDPMQKVLEMLYPKLEGEIRRINMVKDDPEYYSKIKGFERGAEFDIFDELLDEETGKLKETLKSKETYEELNKVGDLSKLLDKNPLLKEKIDKEILTFFDKLEATYNKDLFDPIFGKDKAMPESLKQLILKDIANKPELKLIYSQNIDAINMNIRNAAVRSYMVNNFIHKTETTVFLQGDGFQFDHTKDEMTKRAPGSQSGGTVFPVDQLTKIFIDNKVGRLYEQKLLTDNVIGEKEVRTYGPTLNTAIIEESVVTSVYFDMYRDLFKNDFIKKGITDETKLNGLLYGINPTTGLPGSDSVDEEGNYDDMYDGGKMNPFVNIKDGDGQGWITFDTYRILRRAEGNWNDAQENLFLKVINNEDISASELTDMFPVYKLQYNGPLATETGKIPVQAFHKFSLFPLIPNVIKNFPADTLHKAMIAQNIDYALFPSGSKRSYIKSSSASKGDSVFNGNSANIKPISEIKFTPNTIYISYLKNQTAVNSYFKDKSTFSSQLRKLITSLLYKNGVPVDYIQANKFATEKEAMDAWNKEPYKRTASQFHDYSEEFKQSIDEFVQYKKKELLDELEWTEDDLYAEKVDDVKMQSMLTFLDKELERQGFSANERSVLKSNSNINNLDLSISPLAARFERMIMAIVNNRIVKPKLKGEPLVEVSSALMQSGKFKKPTKEETAKYDDFNGTNGLESYVVDPEGKHKTKGFMFKRALNKMDESLFQLDYFVQDENGSYVNSGESIAVYKPRKKDEEKELDADASLARLNEMLKVKAWRNHDENFKKLRLTGVRIPTQGHNSMEFGEVAEFLNPSAGPIIIIPAEIVAKSGTDFDVDKMTTYMPFLTRSGKLMDKMTEEDINEKEEELKEKFDKLILSKEVIESFKNDKSIKWLDINLKLNNFRKAVNSKANVINIDAKILETLTSNKSKVIINAMNEPGMEEYVKNFIPKAYKIYESKIKGVTLEDLEVINKALEIAYSKKSDLSKVYTERADLNDIKNNMLGGIQNKLIQDMVNILELPYLAASLMSPNDTNLAKPYADKIKEYQQKADNQTDFTLSVKTGKKMYKKGVSPTKIYIETYNNRRHQENFSSKDSLGIAAVDNYINNLLNMSGAVMKKAIKVEGLVFDKVKNKNKKQVFTVDIKLDVPYNKVDDAISLSHILDERGVNSIADVINQMMNGFVDAGKDAWITYLQGNPDVVPKFLFLLEAGVPIGHVAYLVSNPMTRQYVKERAKGKAILSKLLNDPLNPILQPYEVASNMLNNIDFSLETKLNLDPSKEAYLYGLQSALKEKAKPEYFTEEGLEDVAKKSLSYADQAQVAGFLEYLYVEKLIEDYDAMKKAMNPDTKNTTDLYSAQAKIEEVEKLMDNNTLEQNFINKLTTDSIISPFFIQDFARRLFSRVFKLRDDAQVNNFLITTFSNRKKASKAKKATGFDTETYITKFKNFISQYIFANELRVYKSGDTEYKGMIIKPEVLEALNQDFDKGLYLRSNNELDSYNSRGLAPINGQAFPSIIKKEGQSDGSIKTIITPNEKLRNDFIEFGLEREYLRNQISLEDVVESKEFKLRRQRLINSGYNIYRQNEEELKADYFERINKYTYEDMLANKALTNTYNIWQLFRSGDNTVARELMDIITNYPEISESTKYSILKQFMASGIPNSPAYKNVLNFQLKNYSNLDEGLISEYNKQWELLASSSEIKLTSKKDSDGKANQYVSDFFSKLPIYAFLQSGMDSSKFSLSSVMPYGNDINGSVSYTSIMEKASDNFLNKLETTDADKILSGLKKLFEKENSNSNKKLKSRGPLLKVDISDLEGSEENIYEQPFINRVVSDKEIPTGVFTISNTYVKNGREYSVSRDQIDSLQKANPTVYFLLSPTELYKLSNILTPEEINNAKLKIDDIINKIISTGNDVVIFSEGFGDSPKNFFDNETNVKIQEVQKSTPTYPIEPGRFVANQGITYIVTQKNDNGTWQVYNPNAEGPNSKKSFAESNLVAGSNKAIKVTYKDTDYLVTPKDTIISLKTNTKMKWDDNNGDRKAILKLKDAKPVSNQPAKVEVKASVSTDKVLEGDIFALPGIPVITTNLGGVHGAGLAQAAKAKGLVKQGEGNFKATDDVVQLPVKKKWSDDMSMNNNMELLKESLRSLIKVSKESPTKTYLLPLAGLGHGEGSIEEILPLLIKTVQASSNIKLVIPAENVNLGRQGTVRKDYTRENLPKIKTMLSEAGLSTTKPQAPVSIDKKLTKEEADWLMDNLKLITKTYNSSTLNDSIDIELKDPIIIGETKVTHIAPDVSGNPSIIFERPSGKWMIKIEEKKGNLFTRLYKWADYNKKGEFSFYVSEDSSANDKLNIEKAGLNTLVEKLYADTNIPDPGTRLGQFEAANFLQQKYGLKRTYKDIVNQLMSKAQIQTLDFKTIPNLTLERKREIISNFAAKHGITKEEAYKYINEAFNNPAKNKEDIIKKLKECY